MRNAVVNANKLISKGFADYLNEPTLTIGSSVYSRQDMINYLGCGNFNAATRVTNLLKKFHFKNVVDVGKATPADLLRIRGFGATCMWVVMCALEYEGVSIPKWWKWDNEKHTKFSAFQHRVKIRAKKRAA